MLGALAQKPEPNGKEDIVAKHIGLPCVVIKDVTPIFGSVPWLRGSSNHAQDYKPLRAVSGKLVRQIALRGARPDPPSGHGIPVHC